MGVEPTFAVPITDSGLEDRLDYTPTHELWLTFSSEGNVSDS